MSTTHTKEEPRWLKPIVDYAPLIAFFVSYKYSDDLLLATQVIMGVTTLAIALSLTMTRKIPIMPLVTAAIIGIFGGLTIYLQDETFIKMKPTIIQVIFACALGVGLALKRLWIKLLMGGTIHMPDSAWRSLTIRFMGFFLFSAALNEVVWRTQSTDMWVNFKVFGLMALTMVFIGSQLPFIQKHMQDEE
ncbi:MAG: septation protein A [Alphaproteobacteria bacterium]